MIKNKIKRTCVKYTVPFVVGSIAFSVMAADVSSVTTGQNANGEYEIQIGGRDFQGVTAYDMNNPAGIVVDIPNARSRLTQQFTRVSHPVISGVKVIEGDDSVRAFIEMSKSMPYEIVERNNKIVIVVRGQNTIPAQAVTQKSSGGYGANVLFERGSEGQGKVQIRIPNNQTVVDVQRNGKMITARLKGSQFSKTERQNVMDFGTPVKSIDIYRNSLDISTVDDRYELVSYQNNNIFSIEFNRPAKQEQDQNALLPGDSRKKYTGAPLSLNFQDIEVRTVLQLIGEFTGTNIAVTDAVQGSITLRLNDVPWDQALDVILQTKGLSQQKNGDVIFIAPSSVIAQIKKDQYSVLNVEKQLAPLQQQLIQVQYARAENLEKIIEDNSNRGVANKDDNQNDGLLSNRGSVSVDSRTNTIIINDVGSSIDKVRQLVSKLDIPVDQVLIDARIVNASNNFAHDLGARFGIAGQGTANNGDYRVVNSGNLEDTASIWDSQETSLTNRLGVNLAASGKTASSFGLSLLGRNFLIDLELSAMQDSGRGEVISSPRVIAQDGGEAQIKQGTQIAYSTRDEKGKIVTTWKDIPLMLKVRPKIAPNNQIDMELEITKDTVGSIYNGEYGIDTNNITTQVLVDNGETVVLGGVYEQSKSRAVSKVPVLGDIPVIGRAFRRDTNSVKKTELLIFVTPKIVDKRYTTRDKFSSLRK